MSYPFYLLSPFLKLFNPEIAHNLAIYALKNNLIPKPKKYEASILEQRVWGKVFSNPIGLAAGFDKNAQIIDPMLSQGFGFVEIGSVTPLPQRGNPRPRLFRLQKDKAIINRMGFNNDGMDKVAVRLLKRVRNGIVGINLGKNKSTEDIISDYRKGIIKLAPLADYVVINVSSPNTPGLRNLQCRDSLQTILSGVLKARSEFFPSDSPPILLKISPDLSDNEKIDIAKISIDMDIDGLIATNTTTDRFQGLMDKKAEEVGGLSGLPLMELSNRVLSEMYQLTEGKVPIIGVGGISSGEDAYKKIKAGATLVQLYSAMVYHGPGLVQLIKRDLAKLLRADGFTNISEAIGSEHT